MHTLAAPRVPVSITLALVGWLAIAAIINAAGLVGRTGPAIGVIGIAGGVGLGLLAHRLIPSVRAWARAVALRDLIAYQALRAPIGALFLWGASLGRIPHEFADVAGWGDIAAGLLALVALACLPATTPRRRRVVLTWNALGLFDILLVVTTAQRLILVDGRMDMFTAFATEPLMGLLPLFVVPTVILAHLLVFARLRADPRGSRA
jgi:hypothetical protein